MPEREGSGARTVVRPPPPRGGRGDDLYAGLARPLLELAKAAARDPRPDPRALASEARRRVEAFEAGALRAGAAAAAVGDARDALLAVLDARLASNPGMKPAAWARARRKALPKAEDLSADAIARRLAAAEAAGPGARELARFLRHCHEAVAAATPARRPAGPLLALWAPVLLVMALLGWAAWAEWRYSARLLATLPEHTAVLGAAGGSPTAAARQLRLLADAVAAVEARAGDSPLGIAARLGRLGPAAAARRRYAAAADALLPPYLGEAVDTALATEGGSLPLYDTLRARAILTGEAPWQPGFLAGWLEARADRQPALAALAPHAEALSARPPTLAAQDPELLLEARELAAEGSAADFAFLELSRADGARSLPEWTAPAAVPGIETVLARRSGRPLAEGVDGLFTRAGWAFARDGGAAEAIARARTESARLLSRAPPPPDVEALLGALQVQTLAAWSDYLADLRVRPFTDQPSSLLISGTLGRRNSPLEALFRETWRQAGGGDRTRSHPNQLHVGAAFSATMLFLDQGRMAEISRLFASLNVALAALDADAEVGRRRLMNVQARAASIDALEQAPRLVAQIVEDVLAQTAASQGHLKPPAAEAWERELGPACRAAMGGRYPFVGGPNDAPLAPVAALIGPGGAIPRYFTAQLAPLMDISESPWRWKPEARLSGFTPESAAFFEKAIAIGPALFPEAGGAEFTLAALAQRGAATVALGGATAPVDISGEPARLAWPGPDPDAGFRIAFATGSEPAAGERARDGPWGFLRFLDGLRLRERDGGRRYRLDVQAEGARVWIELGFAGPSNLVSARAWLRGLACPATL